MSYTVKDLAKFSGVSIRMLHYYDQIDLLKPAYVGDNGYRYYEEKQLLLLQQILFYKELDFPLDEIRKILVGDDFDAIKALNTHKIFLKKNLERTKELIKTIDKTLLHIRGKQIMENNEIFKGFNEFRKGKGKESWALCGIPDLFETTAETIVLKSAKKEKNENKDKSYWENIDQTGKDLYRKIAQCITEKKSANSSAVQSLIKKHHAFAKKFHEKLNKEEYKAYAELYKEHPAFKKQLEPFDCKLPSFIAEAMEIFADRHLS